MGQAYSDAPYPPAAPQPIYGPPPVVRKEKPVLIEAPKLKPIEKKVVVVPPPKPKLEYGPPPAKPQFEYGVPVAKPKPVVVKVQKPVHVPVIVRVDKPAQVYGPPKVVPVAKPQVILTLFNIQILV